MKKSAQISFLKEPRKNTKLWWIKKQKVYGGSLSYRKVERPFDRKKLVHTVFKAKVGSGIYLNKSQKSITQLLKASAQRYGVKIKELSVQKDHIHVLTWTKHKEDFVKFLRYFSAEMGRKYKSIFKRFGVRAKGLWSHRPFTRLVSWGKKSLEKAQKYIRKNNLEILGFIPYEPRKHQLSIFLKKWKLQQLPSG